MQGEAVTVIGTEKPQGVDTLYGDLWMDRSFKGTLKMSLLITESRRSGSDESELDSNHMYLACRFRYRMGIRKAEVNQWNLGKKE